MDRQTDPQNHHTREHTTAPRRRALRAVAFFLVALCSVHLSGCQIVIGVMTILNGFPKTTCEFTAYSKKRLSEKGKRVIVLATSDGQNEEPSLDLDVIAVVTRRLKADNVKVVEAHKVATWIDDHGGITDATRLDPIGLEFAADYIILFKFTDFGYGEQNSPGLFRGHASVKIVVVEMVASETAPGGKKAKIIYNKPFTSKYPANRPVSAEEVGSPELFKSQYMNRLSEDLARKFIDYRPEDEI